jgi:hypothetical protein
MIGAPRAARPVHEEDAMLVVSVTHPVEDFTRWKATFDAFEETRRASGTTFERVLQDVDDPNMVTVVMGFAERSQADRFLGAPELRDAMQAAGVAGEPQVRFMNEVAAFDY